MAGFRIELFKGIRPRISARKLPIGEAQTAQNAKLGSGDLRAWDEKDSGTAVNKTWYTKTVYRFDNDGTPRWFEWTTLVDVARGPVKDDSIERTYYTGDGVPKMTYTTIADGGGGGPYPEANRDLGIPIPPNPISSPSDALPGNVPAASRTISGLTCNAFRIDWIQFETYPGTGTDNQTWRRSATFGDGFGVGTIAFDIPPGAKFKVIRVVDSNHAVLEAADSSGIFARTADLEWRGDFIRPTQSGYVPMAEQGSTKTAAFLGWIIPEATATFGASSHNLAVGDVITISSIGDSAVGTLNFPISATLDFYEQSWNSEQEEPIAAGDSQTAYVVRNGRVAAAATEGEVTFTLEGEFTYDVSGSATEEATNSEFQDRQYVYTYVSFLGEEGPPSAVSSIVTVRDDSTVELAGFENVFTSSDLSNRDIDFYRIYRTNSSEAGTEFQFVGEIGTGTAGLPTNSFVDTVSNGDLGEALETATWFPPDADMAGIIELPNGILAGFKGKTVFMSEPFFPHAWPPEYDQAVNYDIVGLSSVGNSIVVLTKGNPSIITGSHPRNMNVRPYELNQACENKESIASDGDRVYYASPDGLVEISVNGAKLVTAGWVRKQEWASYVPSAMVGEFHDGKYFGFFDGTDNVTQAPITVALSGTMTSSTDEADIQAGGQVLDMTLTGGTWATTGANFNAQRQNIIDGIVSAQSETNGWNSLTIAVTDVTQVSTTLARVTLSAQSAYEITAAEVLTITLVPTVFASAPADDIIVQTTVGIATEDNFSSKMVFVTDTGFFGYSTGDADQWSVATIEPNALAITVTNSPANGAQHIAYDTKRSRWTIAVGETIPNSRPVTYTSDNDSSTWIRQAAFDNVFETAGVVINHFRYYEEYDLFLGSFGQITPLATGHSALYSKDGGKNWDATTVDVVDGTEMVSGETGFDTLAGTFFAPAYKGASDTPKLIVAPASSPQNVWPAETTAINGTELDMLDCVSTGNGIALYAWLSGVDNDIEIAYYKPTDQSHNDVGVLTNSGATALFSAFGNSKFMIMQDDNSFTIATADDSEQSIGNWSAMSTPITGSGAITVSNLYYDGGDGVTAGWGWVMVGTDEGDSKGVVYNSADNGATWTLRHKTAANAVILSAAFSNYTSDLDKA